jgi:hypothetical protein
MASGDTLDRFSPLHYEPRSSSAATLDIRNQHPVIDFDASNVEFSRFSSVMPRAYDGGGLTVYYHVAFSSATSGTAGVYGSFEMIGDHDLDIDADSFATAKRVVITPAGTSGIVTIDSGTFGDGAGIDSIAVGDGYRFEVYRDVGITGDPAGDLELRFIEIKET